MIFVFQLFYMDGSYEIYGAGGLIYAAWSNWYAFHAGI
jgi:hypothetical protein